MMMLPTTWTGSQEGGALDGDVFGCCDCVGCVLIWVGYYMFSSSVDVYLCALRCCVCLECLFGCVCALDMCVAMVGLSMCVSV